MFGPASEESTGMKPARGAAPRLHHCPMEVTAAQRAH